MRRLCIIPAREGSKRIPKKNIKDFQGKPMLLHSLEAAKSSCLFDCIHVSTDSGKISDIVGAHGAQPDFLRSKDLSGDHASLMDVIKFVIETYEIRGKFFDTIAIVYATSPLIDTNDLVGACEEFEDGDRLKALLAIAPFPAPVEKSFLMKGEGDLSPMNEEAFSRRSQDLNEAYYDAGMFCFYTPDYIKSVTGAGDFNKFRGYVVPSYRVTDIDYPEDWERAEILFAAIEGRNLA